MLLASSPTAECLDRSDPSGVAIAAVLVDFDDTLVVAARDWVEVFGDAAFKLAQRQGYRRATEVRLWYLEYLRGRRGETLTRFSEALAEKLSFATGPEVVRTALQSALEIDQRRDGALRVNVQILAVCKSLIQLGWPWHVLTGGWGAHKRELLGIMGLQSIADRLVGDGDPCFHHCVSKEEVASRLLSMCPRGVQRYVIGDSPLDGKMAHSVGAQFVSVGSDIGDLSVSDFQTYLVSESQRYEGVDCARQTHQRPSMSSPLTVGEQGETVVRTMSGGSESETTLIRASDGGAFVRKVADSSISRVDWSDSDGPLMMPPTSRLLAQARYLQNLPSEVRPLFPAVHGVSDSTQEGGRRVVLDMENVPGLTVSELGFRDPSCLPGLYARIDGVLSESFHQYWRVMNADRDYARVMHLTKMVARHNTVLERDALCWACEMAGAVEVNGQPFMALARLLEEVERHPSWVALMAPPVLCLVMGDTNTHNIKVRPNGDLAFLDPRGIGAVPSDRRVVDDPLYDWKYLHNALGHYDAIYDGEFVLSWDDSSIGMRFGAEAYARMGDHAQRFLAAFLAKEHDAEFLGSTYLERFLFLMGSHFISMLPFHLGRMDRRGRHTCVSAIYLEGLYWLNSWVQVLREEASAKEVLGRDYWRVV